MAAKNSPAATFNVVSRPTSTRAVENNPWTDVVGDYITIQDGSDNPDAVAFESETYADLKAAERSARYLATAAREKGRTLRKTFNETANGVHFTFWFTGLRTRNVNY